MYKNARLSVDRRHRYWLMRQWNPAKSHVAFVGLNPSTADMTFDDATTRRLIDFAQRWGYGGYILVNLFTFRARSPRTLLDATLLDRNAPDADEVLAWSIGLAQLTVCCWGANARDTIVRGRAAEVTRLLARHRVQPYAFASTRGGHPAHPLYLPAETTPTPIDLARIYHDVG